MLQRSDETIAESDALQELLAQHATLRELMTTCGELADAIDAGGGDPSRLTREVAKLRIEFAAHNEFEEALLRPVLARDAFGPLRIEAMVAEHVDEHRAMRTRLTGSPVVAVLREVIENLRAHLDAEERYFLSARVLRGEVGELESST